MNQIFLDISDATPSIYLALILTVIAAFVSFPFIVIIVFNLIDKMTKKK